MALGLGVLDAESRSLELCMMGMPKPYHYQHCDGGRVTPIELKGMALGFMKRVRAKTKTVTLAPGDAVILLSDGITERWNRDGTMWLGAGFEPALPGICREHSEAGSIADAIIDACDIHSQGLENDDDMTVLVVKARPDSE